MRMRRWLDKAYAAGRADALTYRPPNPVLPGAPGSRDGRYWRMAYDAGYTAGKADAGRIERRRHLERFRALATNVSEVTDG